MATPASWYGEAERLRRIHSPPTSCFDGAWPCYEHDRHVLKRGRYWPGSVPEEYGPGDWEPADD